MAKCLLAACCWVRRISSIGLNPAWPSKTALQQPVAANADSPFAPHESQVWIDALMRATSGGEFWPHAQNLYMPWDIT